MLQSSNKIRLSKLNVSFITNITREQLGNYSYIQKVLFVVYTYLLVNNLLSNIPYSFTNTAQFVTSFSLSISIFISIINYGLYFNGKYFFNLFLPSGVPLVLSPLLIAIELLSFSSRVVSLAVRLSANLISGHTLMHMISFGCSSLIVSNIFIVFPVPFIILFALSIIEIAISFLQAYVFVLLSLAYFHDSIYLH